MQKSLGIILVLIFNLTFGQEKNDRTDSFILEFKTKLNEKGISDFFVVKRITYGSVYIYDLNDSNSCNSNGTYFTMYAFWKNGKDSYVKKYDNCGGFNSLKLSDSKLINLYKKNIEKLKSEKVKYYQSKPDSIGKNGLVYKNILSQNHQPQRYFWFFTKSTEFTNRFNTFNLTTEKDNPNLNYKTNNELKLVKLNAICDEIIDEFNYKNMFNRIE
ncbi:hypothetical protein SAMN05216480_10432 [Pustulibacterium marinum]|uniref:Uncharacterized protein n=1 Tax=Pustulibacterium marinum TaxID=1224947 RepID=A0A1I7GAP8_9FLAO|nr:hypothetical protein [Pustulibacterium marinum]SFU45441.1 hypothetical protein SAMN05216480_10432 [Pustulibacterium marinum]